ncbi:NADH-quinone oxidoreductase subunit L [Puniceicoccaceae bacterium K14]|nr:NADH-quinone oxidoreductase subunit L [Puniceicoccaceae bacterium K14]
MNPEVYAFGLLAIPLLSAAIIACCLRRNGAAASGLSVGAAALILATALHIIFRVDYIDFNTPWFEMGPLSLGFGFLVNDLAKMMLFVVAFVGFLVHVFSLGYMKDDVNKARFFGGLSIFMFSMLGLVLSRSLVTLFIFWELVGFSSYMLIGFYLNKPSAAAAAKKAFIVNRVGDFGFLIGIIMIFWTFGTVDLVELKTHFDHHPEAFAVPGLTAMALFLFCGTLGKSGQLPLHVWLPDAMEGPTPVSALIHAATMVAAGIFLLCRTGFMMTVDALQVIAWVGVVTALFAGFTAIAQRDIKKILAYSTVSQLGYMVAGFGFGSIVALNSQGGGHEHMGQAVVTGGVAAAMFHLTTHAFFKALLFLGSGSIIHACHHEQDIFKMGGLSKKMPITFVTFTIATLALTGFPLLAGFFSKDAILAVALQASPLAFYLLVLGAFLTAFYMIRLWGITFFGEPKSDNADHAKENGLVMTVPLILLAVLAVLGGYKGIYMGMFSEVLDGLPHPTSGEHTTILIFSLLAVIAGYVLSIFFYKLGAKDDKLENTVPALHSVLSKKFYFDEAYNFYVAKIQQRVASGLHFAEQLALSGLIIRGLAGVTGLIGIGLRALHVGSIHAYVYWFVGGLALFYAFASGLF